MKRFARYLLLKSTRRDHIKNICRHNALTSPGIAVWGLAMGKRIKLSQGSKRHAP